MTTITIHYSDEMTVDSNGQHIALESRTGAFVLGVFMAPAQARELAQALLSHADDLDDLEGVEVTA